VSSSSYRGRPTILAFLDSTCRACLLIAQQIRGALGELANPPPVLLVSADPANDTPARIDAFLRETGLTGRARYLVGPRHALAAVLRAYRVLTPSRGEQAFETAATVYLLDREGRERVLYQQEQLTPEALAHDVRVLEGG
jgi:protein SCO1/2